MNSRLYVGTLAHARLHPVPHAFRYPVYLYAFDLDELPALERTVPGFGYNRLRPIALHDRDYLDRGPGTIRAKLGRVLAARGIDDVTRVELLTGARFLGLGFNPVSFHFAHRADDSLRAIVAEVNNTFGERHLYVLDDLESGDDGRVRSVRAKQFHVSPFEEMSGTYEFEFARLGDRMDIGIQVRREGRLDVTARLTGYARPLTTGAIVRTIAAQPLSAVATMPRIVAQAAVLRFRKGLRVRPKPVPSSPDTIRRRPPGLFLRGARRLVLGLFGRIALGRLDVTLPDGAIESFGRADATPRAAMTIHDDRFFGRVLLGGAVGIGESFTAGEWTSDDVTGVLARLVDNRHELEFGPRWPAWIGRLVHAPVHRRRPNTRAGSRSNIRAHYDLGNDFFGLFLDPDLTYSSALFRRPDETLEQAQANKLAAVIRKSGIGPGQHLLEIGCGWGSLALSAARTVGCRVTGVTLSREQLAEARTRARDQGLHDLVTFRDCDYRDLDGRYDAIASVEMLEAVGHRYYGGYFRALDRLLKPGGRAVIQVITIADQRYESYRRDCDWIQKHVFPGGHVPSITALTAAMTRHSRFVVEDLHSMGFDYAHTLRVWRERLRAAWDDAARLGYGRDFLRSWEYYLSYCEAGFLSREISVVQLVLVRPGERASATVPVLRP